MARTLSYAVRDFKSLKEEQYNYIKNYYPDLINNFNDGSIMSVLADLNAGIADTLNHGIDRSVNEVFLYTAQKRESLYRLAETYGLSLPNKSASIAICQFTVQVPAFGDDADPSYMPILKAGTQVLGGNNSYELLYDVDFSSPFNISGVLDRTKTPITSNGIIVAYRLTKTGIVIAGISKVFTQVFGNADVKPFYSLILPDDNVLSVQSVIMKPGTNLSSQPSINDFSNENYLWYEVDALAQKSVFVRDRSKAVDSNGIPAGKWLETTKRYIKKYLPNNQCKITFGNQTNSGFDILDDFVDGGTFDLQSLLNNSSLGEAPFKNHTMYIRYRIGGGSNSNVGVNVINSFGTKYIEINGSDVRTNAVVEGSLSVTNVTPAVGGGEELDIEELRNMIAYNFASQKRAVTLNDYKALLVSLPKDFGAPAKVGVRQVNNKIEVNLLSYDNEGKISNQVTSTVMENVGAYLSNYRMLNDYILIKPGQVIDLGFEVSVLIDNTTQIETSNRIIDLINSEFENSKIDTGRSYNLGRLIRLISNIDTVQNINFIKVYNKVGGQYSSNTINQPLNNTTTREVNTSNNILKCESNQILQIRYPQRDIIVRTTTLSNNLI